MKKTTSLFLTLALAASLMAGCAKAEPEPTAAPAAEETTAAAETAAPETEAAETEAPEAGDAVRVASLKGPTSIGLVSLMNAENPSNEYEFTMVTAPDELIASVAAGKTDIALLPANASSVLYNKTEKGISVIDINTLGVLYLVSADDSIKSAADLKGRTICLTGKGATPDYVLHHILSGNGLSDEDVTLEYKSEAAEVASVLQEKPDAVGLLPQPFVTVACAQNEALHVLLDMTEEWNKLEEESGSMLVTGVTIVQNEFLENHPDQVEGFLRDHEASITAVNGDPEAAAELVVKAGILPKAPIAKKAIPGCSLSYIDGEEMKTALSGYLKVLFEQNPKSVGGALPDDAFYYIP